MDKILDIQCKTVKIVEVEEKPMQIFWQQK